jgi:hypothetical protein
MSNNTELNAYIKSKKDLFIDKMKDNIVKIETDLNVKIDYLITENDHSVFIKGVDTYSYFASKWFPAKINPDVKMCFRLKDNPSLVSNNNKSLLSFSINEDFEVLNVRLRN